MSAAEQLEQQSISLVDLLLEEQASLTAVEKFAQQHERTEEPLQARYYRDLIPATPPAPGEQYAFRVDLDACTGCKACVTACHNLNGLAPEETWREVGLLVGESPAGPVQQTVTTACHHCEDPGCMNGCPVRAYEKDPVTGIVRHLDDQCIGCQYCLLKCPYDVPKYDPGRGIVRKCDMCSDRLAEGEAPACVQGCPNEAISIEKVRVGTVPPAILPARSGTVPDSGITRPTTRYVGGAADALLQSADLASPEPGDPHLPLSAMLVLSQLAVGAFALEAVLGLFDASGGGLRIGVGMAAAALGLGVANLHLGRPQYAFRAILGLRTSWMSREIIVLGAFAGNAAATTALALAASLWPELVSSLPIPASSAVSALTAATAAVGALAVFCSVMIYADTGRAAWHLSRTGPAFLGTTIVLGLGAASLAALASGSDFALTGPLLLGWAAALAWKLRVEGGWLDARSPGEVPALERSRTLLAGVLAPRLQRRRAAGQVGLALSVGALLAATVGLPLGLGLPLAGIAFALCAAGEWMERDLFFRACAPVGMPGTA